MLLELAEHRDSFLGGKKVELPLFLQAPELVEAVDAVGDRAPVRQQPAEPAVIDVGHADTLRLFLDCALALLLRAHEEHRAAALGEIAHEGVSFLQQLQCLLEVDDVDAAPLREDEAAHLWVPTARLVTEVDSGLQEFAHSDDGHRDDSPFWLEERLLPAG